MKKITPITTGLILLSLVGCAQLPTEIEGGNQTKVDIEPSLVGVPFSQRVNQTSENINNQLDLLKKVKTQDYVGTFEMVKHNNGLDARVGSEKTIPRAYIKAKEDTMDSVEEVSEVKHQDVVNEEIFKKKISVLDWQNNSVKELAKMFASSIGFTFVSNSNVEDFNVTLKLEGITIGEAMDEFKKKIAPKFNLVIAPKTKTITLVNK